jgi:hypothetical protein
VVLAPTPPPDIDLEAWRRSLSIIAARRPDTLFLAHFGPSSPFSPHLGELSAELERQGDRVRASLAREESDQDREAWFVEEVRRDLRRRLSEEEARIYEVAARFDLSWRGLARYWRKKEGARA